MGTPHSRPVPIPNPIRHHTFQTPSRRLLRVGCVIWLPRRSRHSLAAPCEGRQYLTVQSLARPDDWRRSDRCVVHREVSGSSRRTATVAQRQSAGATDERQLSVAGVSHPPFLTDSTPARSPTSPGEPQLCQRKGAQQFGQHAIEYDGPVLHRQRPNPCDASASRSISTITLSCQRYARSR